MQVLLNINDIWNFVKHIPDYVQSLVKTVIEFYNLCVSTFDLLPTELKAILMSAIPILIIIITTRIKK